MIHIFIRFQLSPEKFSWTKTVLTPDSFPMNSSPFWLVTNGTCQMRIVVVEQTDYLIILTWKVLQMLRKFASSARESPSTQSCKGSWSAIPLTSSILDLSSHSEKILTEMLPTGRDWEAFFPRKSNSGLKWSAFACCAPIGCETCADKQVALIGAGKQRNESDFKV